MTTALVYRRYRVENHILGREKVGSAGFEPQGLVVALIMYTNLSKFYKVTGAINMKGDTNIRRTSRHHIAYIRSFSIEFLFSGHLFKPTV